MNDLIRHGPERDTLDDQARRAVSAFRSIQPTLTAYARVLTGRKEVRVVAAATDNGSTDGTRINFRPPISLGDPTPHNRHLCDKRDEVGLHLCPACKIREEVLVTIYHEIAHICFDSFAPTSDEDKKKAIEYAIKEAKGKWAKQIADRIEKAPPWKTRDYINLVSLINNYLPFLLNALEDARVNAALFRARPGVKRMFDADERRIFEEGFEGVNSKTKEVEIQRWNQAPLNSQVMIGCYCKASGYKYSEWFHPKVVEALNDEQLTSLIREVDTARSAGAIYNITFRVLARLRELGYCGTPEDPDPEPEPEPDQEEDSDEGSSTDESGPPDSDEVPPEPCESGTDGDGGEPGSSSDAEAPEGSEDGEPEPSDDEPSGGSEEGDTDSSDGREEDESGSSGGGVEDEDSEGQSEADQDPSATPESDDSGDSEGDPRDAGSGGGTSEGASEEGSGSDTESPSVDEEDHLDSSESPGQESDLGDAEDESGSDLDAGGDAGDGSGPEDHSSEPSPVEGSHEGDSSVPEDDDEALDTGADDGYGGTQVDKNPEPTPEMGSPDDIDGVLELFGNHEEKPKSSFDLAAEDAVDTAVIQGIYFNTPSQEIRGVREHYYGQPVIEDGINYSHAWRESRSRRTGAVAETKVPESILQPALLKTRRAFTDNKRGANIRNKKSGRVNAAVLGRRAWNDDPRLFHKRVLPGKKDYFVVIGMDISGSTIGVNLALEKRAIMAQAELLHRVGVPFAIYAHTGNYANTSLGSRDRRFDLEGYHIKDPNEPWSSKEKERLDAINSSAANIDGHALEYLRKVADTRPETDKIILYYSDGKMPAENYNEELEILVREIQECKKKNYTLLGVGIRTDSPRAHGLDTVEVHEDGDLVKVIDHLNKRLTGQIRR